MYKYKDIVPIFQTIFNENFENICDWFVHNKVSIHFGDDTTNF